VAARQESHLTFYAQQKNGLSQWSGQLFHQLGLIAKNFRSAQYECEFLTI
jgi:hypothetical protein